MSKTATLMTSHVEFGDETEVCEVYSTSADQVNLYPENILSIDNLDINLVTNYLESFLFTNLITNALTVKGGARIVNMSGNDFSSPFRFADQIIRGDTLRRLSITVRS